MTEADLKLVGEQPDDFTPEQKRYLEGFRVWELSEDPKGWQKTFGPKHDWPIRETSPATWIALFGIDWRRNDSELLADLAAWINVYRPKAFPSQVGPDTGAGTDSRRLQVELKVLGALRLLRFYQQWQNIPLDAMIYESRGGWMTAQQKAKKRLKFFQL